MTNNMCFCVIVYCTLFVIAYFITTHNVNVKCRRQHSIQQRSHFVYLEDISQFALPNGICWHKHLVIRHTTWRGIIRDQRRPRQKKHRILVCSAKLTVALYTVRAFHPRSGSGLNSDGQEAQLSLRDRAMRRVSWNLANCHATVQKLLVRQVLNQVQLYQLSLIDSCDKIFLYRQRLTICAINYSGRASELGCIIDLVDRRRPSLSRSERPPFSS